MEERHGTALLEQPQARAIPPVADFPITWERPEDAMIPWRRDLMHFGNPITPLDGSYARRFMEHGFGTAAATFEAPIRAQMRRINTFYYDAYVPVSMDPAVLASLGARAEERLRGGVATLREDWENVYLPEIKRYLADWAAFDLGGATMPALIAHFDESVARFERLTAIHFLIGAPMLLGMSLFDEFYRDLFGTTDAFDSFKLQ